MRGPLRWTVSWIDSPSMGTPNGLHVAALKQADVLRSELATLRHQHKNLLRVNASMAQRIENQTTLLRQLSLLSCALIADGNALPQTRVVPNALLDDATRQQIRVAKTDETSVHFEVIEKTDPEGDQIAAPTDAPPEAPAPDPKPSLVLVP